MAEPPTPTPIATAASLDELRGLDGTAVFLTPAEKIDAEEAARLLREHYGIDGAVSDLGGERDSNFIVDDGTRRLMLKAVHPQEDPQVTDCQTLVLAHLEERDDGLPIPRLVPTRDGAADETISSGPAAGRRLRLTTFLSGRAPLSLPLEGQAGLRVREHLGEAGARLTLALAGFEHPALDLPMLWDIERVPMLRPMFETIADRSLRSAAARIARDFEERVQPSTSTLRTQAVHNDLSSDNALVDPLTLAVTGIIDFGDMTRTRLINDVAVGAAYLLTDDDDPIAGAVAFVRGYDRVLPLEPEERAWLLDLIRARMVTRTAIPAWRARSFPENAPYIARNTERVGRQLSRILNLSPTEFERRLTA